MQSFQPFGVPIMELDKVSLTHGTTPSNLPWLLVVAVDCVLPRANECERLGKKREGSVMKNLLKTSLVSTAFIHLKSRKIHPSQFQKRRLESWSFEIKWENQLWHISCCTCISAVPFLDSQFLLGTCRVLQMLMLRCFAKNTSERTPEQSVRGHRATCRILNPLAPDISRTIQLNCHCAIFPLTTPGSSVDIGKVLTDSTPKKRCNSINSHEKRWLTIKNQTKQLFCLKFGKLLSGSKASIPQWGETATNDTDSGGEEKAPDIFKNYYILLHDVCISQKAMMIFCGSLGNCQLSMSGLKRGPTPRRS